MSDIDLRHSDAGEGNPVIVLVHGFASGPEDWQPQADHLAARHRVITVALRGHGISARGQAAMTMEQLAADCLELIRAKGIDRAVFGGHSMGTRIAIDAHRQAPDLVKGLILADGSNSTALADLDAVLAGFRTAVAATGYRAFAEALFAQMFYDPELDDLKQKLIARALAVPEQIGRPLYENLIRWDGTRARDALSAADIPILVVQSTTRDASGGRRTLQAGEVGAYERFVAQLAPHAEIVGLPGYGHYTMLEAADEVNSAIDRWLDRHNLRG